MIIIKNVQKINGEITDLELPSLEEKIIDGTGLTALPALIDTHVHFRTPGSEHKEDWQTGAQAAIAGGVTTVIDMPNNTPVCSSFEDLKNKRTLINKQLEQVGIPLRFKLYLGAEADNLGEITKSADQIAGVKVYLGSSTGDLLLEDEAVFDKACAIASENNLLVAIHAEDEQVLKHTKYHLGEGSNVADHSRLRPREAAVEALKKALRICRKYGNQLFVMHISTAEEVKLIKKAKDDGLPVFAEVAPHHLFLNQDDYERLGNLVKVNPPLRTKGDNLALWEAIKNGTIDAIGTDHAPHTLDEKQKPYSEAPAGMPGIENYLALLLDAYHAGKIDLPTIVRLTHDNPQKIFGLPENGDLVLVDLQKEKVVNDSDQKTKCGWSPYSGMKLKGWPVYTILGERVYQVV